MNLFKLFRSPVSTFNLMNCHVGDARFGCVTHTIYESELMDHTSAGQYHLEMYGLVRRTLDPVVRLRMLINRDISTELSRRLYRS